MGAGLGRLEKVRLQESKQILYVSLTWRYIMVWVERDFLFHLDIVDSFQYGEPMSHAYDPHLFQVIMLESDQGFADNFVL